MPNDPCPAIQKGTHEKGGGASAHNETEKRSSNENTQHLDVQGKLNNKRNALTLETLATMRRRGDDKIGRYHFRGWTARAGLTGPTRSS